MAFMELVVDKVITFYTLFFIYGLTNLVVDKVITGVASVGVAYH
jgi:hypothetical protein